MGTFLEFTVPGKPQQQGSKIANRFGGMREANKELAGWRELAISRIVAELGAGEIEQGPVRLTAEFYFTRPRSHYGTGRNSSVLKPQAPIFHAQTPDLDKLLRALGDALTQAGAIRDDRQITRITSGKYWTAGAAHSWVIVEGAQ